MNEIPRADFHKSSAADLNFTIFSIQYALGLTDTQVSLTTPHRNRFNAIIFITQGEGKHFIDFKNYCYEKNDFLIVATGQVHGFIPNNNVDGHIMLFTDDFLIKQMTNSDANAFKLLFQQFRRNPIVKMSDSERESCCNIMAELYKERHGNQDAFREAIIQTLLKTILLKINRATNLQHNAQIDTVHLYLFHQFLRLLQENHTEIRQAQFYANRLGVSTKLLNTICKSLTGDTVKKVIDESVIMETKRLLATTAISIYQIADQLGFDEPTNFVKFFKRHVALTPAQFRKQLQQMS